MKRFFLCNDPNEVMPDGVLTYIYGFDKPRFFAALRKLDDGIPFTSIAYLGITLLFYFRTPGKDDTSVYLLSVSDNIDEENHHDLLDVLKEAAEWYVYTEAVKADVKRIDFRLLKEFSKQLNGFQLLEDASTGACLLNFAVGAQGFADKDSALKFLEKQLNVDRQIVYASDTTINH